MHPFLERAHHEQTPLIDGDQATFLWEGESAPRLIGDFNGWGWKEEASGVLTSLDPGIWAYTLTLPSDTYMEYAFFDGEERVNDPLNSRTIANGTGNMNHFFAMPSHAFTNLTELRDGELHGTVTQHIVGKPGDYYIIGGQRDTWLYQPPTAGPYPLVVVFDGQDYLDRAQLTHIVDNLIVEKRITPIALALVAHGGQARFMEYACSEATLAFLMNDVLPLARESLDLIDVDAHPGAYGVLGASMGGLIALFSALRLPGVFGKVLSQSGAFALNIHGQDPAIFDLVRASTQKSLDIWMDVGRFEYLIEANQKMRTLLDAQGHRLAYREFNGGHNYTMWRDEVADGLIHLFPTQS